MNIHFSLLNKLNNWTKVGKIFSVKRNKNFFSFSHSSVPCHYFIDKNLIKIFFSTRSRKNESHIFSINYDLKEKKIIKSIEKYPLIAPGKNGLFDDSGVTPTKIIKFKKEILIYYVGWKSGGKTRMSLFTGLATSKDLKKFKKYSNVPILERNNIDPYLTASLSIIKERKIFKMWYVSGDGWFTHNKQSYPKYNIKYATSKNGFVWKRDKTICINYNSENEYAIAKPSVIKIKNSYFMWYCYKKINQEYKIGMASSRDGKKWVRHDNLNNLSSNVQSWENNMQCYPDVFINNNYLYILYNGNNYGESGIGLAYIKLDD
jgi:predicted GH43/DUF377 family glycosyl hydrolase